MDKNTFEKLGALLSDDGGDEIVYELINKVIEVVGVKNIVAGIPDDWPIPHDDDIDTLEGLAWHYLYDQLTNPQANDTGWDAGTENMNHFTVEFIDNTKEV